MAEDDMTPRQDMEAEIARRTQSLELECRQKTKQLLDSQSKLVQAEKMAALGSLAAGLAHEINTPLGAITSSNENLEAAFARVRELVRAQAPAADARLADIFDIIDGSLRTNRLACDRLVRIVRNVRNFARVDEASAEKADIHEGLESTLTLLNHQLKGRIQVIREFGDVPLVQCYPNQLNQVFMNVLMNAAQSIEGTGEIRIKTWTEGGSLHVAVTDSGRGMSPDVQARVFEPGFTTKKAGVGTGLGLAISQKIIHNHNGRIDVESSPGRGSTFSIVLPIAEQAERKTNGER